MSWVPTDPPPDWVLLQRRHVGTRLRSLRMARGWSQEQLGERAGLDRRTISSIELGARSPLLDHVFLIADALGVPTRQVFE